MLNADDPSVDVWRAAARARAGVRVIEFALDHPAAVRLRGEFAPAGGPVAFATPAGDAVARLAAPGRHNVSNALAAAAAALAVGVPLSAVVRGLEAFRPVAGRLVALRSGAGATVIDDTYNANPDSVRVAIDVLAAAPPPRWLVLGDMGEVGAERPGVPSRGRSARAGRRHRPAADGRRARGGERGGVRRGRGALRGGRSARRARCGDRARRHDRARQGLAVHADGAGGRRVVRPGVAGGAH